MNKKIFSIIASLIMILTIFGAISASAQECVRLSGTVKAKFMNVWCDDELEILPLSGVIVTIEKIGDDGETVATTFTTTNEDGYYEQEVLKGTFFNPKTYRVSIKTTIMIIYGENYVFPGETKTIQVKGNPVTVDFSPMGTITKSKNIFNINMIIHDMITNILERFISKFPIIKQ